MKRNWLLQLPFAACLVLLFVFPFRLAGYVEALASRLGMQIPDLSPKQADMWQTRVSSHSVGIIILHPQTQTPTLLYNCHSSTLSACVWKTDKKPVRLIKTQRKHTHSEYWWSCSIWRVPFVVVAYVSADGSYTSLWRAFSLTQLLCQKIRPEWFLIRSDCSSV